MFWPWSSSGNADYSDKLQVSRDLRVDLRPEQEEAAQTETCQRLWPQGIIGTVLSATAFAVALAISCAGVVYAAKLASHPGVKEVDRASHLRHKSSGVDEDIIEVDTIEANVS